MDQCENTAGNWGVSGTSAFLSGYTLNQVDREKKFSGKDNEFCFEHIGLKGIMWDLRNSVQKQLKMWFQHKGERIEPP